MLTSDQFDALNLPILELYEKYQTSVINDMARRMISLKEVTSATVWEAQVLQASGLVFEDTVKRLSAITGQREDILRATFEKAGITSMRFDDSIYRAAGLNPIPLNLSPAMSQVLLAGLTKTNGVMHNLTKTTAVSAQKQFIEAADLAYLQVRSGAMSYDQAIKGAVKSVASDGLYVHYPSGRRDKVDVAMRRGVLTGVAQTTAQLQDTRADEMGQDLVQTSAHIGARPEHQAWQGRIFSRSGKSKKYPDFVESTGYGTGPGLAGWNCRHSYYPYFRGISKAAYDALDLESAANKTVTYNGGKLSAYEATQEQRYIERTIRKWKRESSALSSSGIANTLEVSKVKEWQARMRSFTNQTGLSRQYPREQI